MSKNYWLSAALMSAMRLFVDGLLSLLLIRAALKLLRKLLQSQGISPTKIVADKLRSYGAALRDLNIEHVHGTTNRLNNRAESSHPKAGAKDATF